MSVNINISNDIVEINEVNEVVQIVVSGGIGPAGPTGPQGPAGTGTVNSINLTAGTGISVSGGPITVSGNINVVNTAPDQVVSLTGSGTTTISGTYPNFTITSADSNVGTVTSVNMTVPTGLVVSGNPITSTGTLAIALQSGFSIPTTASQATWDSAYNDKINSAAVTGTSTKTLTLNQQDGGTVTASWTDDNTVTSVFSRTGVVVATNGDYTTSQVTEGTNLYFLDSRARAAISAGASISYNNTTGVITNAAPDQVVSITAGSGISTSGTYPSFTVASTITQYTDALSRLAISLTTTGTSGASTYSSYTGVLNIPNYTLAGLGGLPLSGGTLTGNLFGTNATFDKVISNSNSINAAYEGNSSSSGDVFSGLSSSSANVFKAVSNSTGLNYSGFNSNILTFSVNKNGDISANSAIFLNNVTASSFIKSGGTSLQFLKSDGSVDSTVYQATGNYITALTGEVTASGPGSAVATVLNSAVIGKVLTGLNLTGGGTIVNTDTILQAFGKTQNQISALVGGVNYDGVWNATTNTPAIVSSVGSKGDYYVVNVAGSTSIDGINDWKVGDWIIFNGTVWDKVDNTDAVSSVNSFVGAVSLTTANIPEVTSLYYLDSRARLALSFIAGSGAYNSSTGAITIPTNNNQIANGSSFISLTSISAGTGISYSNTTGVISNTITQYTDALARASISLTTTGTSGAATYNNSTGVLNIPNYGSALSGYLPLTGGTLTGALTGTSASFSSTITSGSITANSGGRTLTFDNITNFGQALTINAAGSLDLRLQNNGVTSLLLISTGAAAFSSSVTAPSFIPNGSSVPTLGMYSSAANTLNFATNTTNRLSIDSAGAATFSSSVTALSYIYGVGVFSSKDDTSSVPNQFQVTGVANANKQLLIGYNTSGNGYGCIQAVFQSVTVTPLVLNPIGGNVGIGTTSPGRQLELAGTADAYIQLTRNNTGVQATLGFNTGATNDWLIRTDDASANLKFYSYGISNYSLILSRSTGAATFSSSVTIDGVLQERITANRQTASYTLVLTDRGKLIEMNIATANNLTVPLNSSVAFPIGTKIDVSQYGAGQTTLVATSGVTVRSAGGALKLALQYSGASLVKIDANEWYLFGNITV